VGDPDIKTILAERLRLRQAALENARVAFQEATSDIPSPLPRPDGTQNIKNAGGDYRAALNWFAVALQEFSEFNLHGTVPEFLKEAIRIANRQREPKAEIQP